MIQFYADYVDNMAELHSEIMKVVRHLPVEALDWVPSPDGNSISVLVVHTAGAEKFWLGDVVGKQSSGRDRPAEFQVRGLTAHNLEAKLTESLGLGELILRNLALEDLQAVRIDPRSNQEVTVAWALAHALNHTALHLGHIQVTRDFWSQAAK